jgi:uncharacterized protein (DUF1778 family)
MAKKASKPKMVTGTGGKTSQARLELPAEDMEQVRKAARSLGLSLSAFVRMAVLERARRVREGRD